MLPNLAAVVSRLQTAPIDEIPHPDAFSARSTQPASSRHRNAKSPAVRRAAWHVRSFLVCRIDRISPSGLAGRCRQQRRIRHYRANGS